jgi:hypothetical protein
MKEEKTAIMSTLGARILSQLQKQIKMKIDQFNVWFNSLPVRVKQGSVIFFGMTVAMICIMLIVHAIQTTSDAIPINKITLPNDINMNKTDTNKHLTPVGKLKGEINGEFEAFYVAVDGEGQVFVNRNPSYEGNRYLKSSDWLPIDRKQLEAYEKELHFIPHKEKSLKP